MKSWVVAELSRFWNSRNVKKNSPMLRSVHKLRPTRCEKVRVLSFDGRTIDVLEDRATLLRRTVT